MIHPQATGPIRMPRQILLKFSHRFCNVSGRMQRDCADVGISCLPRIQFGTVQQCGQRGRPIDAEAEYKAALRLSPEYAPAAANLANLYRGLGREADGENLVGACLFQPRCRRCESGPRICGAGGAVQFGKRIVGSF